MRMPTHCTVTEEHLKLLRHAYVHWEDCEFGAPAIDCKRPYGNSDVIGDMAEILGSPKVENRYGEKDVSPAEADRLTQLHYGTLTALQIVLVTGEMRAGEYVRTSEYGLRSWVRAVSERVS